VDDYFAGSVARPQAAPPPPQYAPPPQPFAPPAVPQQAYPQQAYPQQPVQPPPFARQGWAPPPGAVPPPGAGYPAYPQQAWGQPGYAPPPTSGGQKALIGIVVAVAAFVIVGILAAVAIPVFLGQRDLSKHTTVAAPELLLGMPRLTDPNSVASEQKVMTLPGPGDRVVGIYGIGQSRILVLATRYHMSSHDKRDFLAAATSEGTQQGVTLRAVDAGKLGGSLKCGDSTQVPLTFCVFVDGGSYGIVAVMGSDDPNSTARSAREAFVHRT